MTRRDRHAALLICPVLGAALSSCSPSPGTPPPSGPETPPAVGSPLFVDATADSGIDFVHTAGELEDYFFPAIMAGGCALLDFDRDGRLDVYLVNGNSGTRTGSAGAQTAPLRDRLYRQTEDGRFLDVTADAGIGDDPAYGMGVAVGDVNNDGFPDVYVTNYGPDRLYLNQRDGTFRDVTAAAGIDNILWSASAGFLDYDRDGRLDVFVTNYVDYFAERSCPDTDGRNDFCGPQVFFNTVDRLYHNVSDAADGSGPGVLFEDVSAASGIAAQPGPGLGVVCADFDGDRWCDVYVANDRAANFLWINQRDGTFVDEAVPRGVALDGQGRAQAGMGIALGDVNRDAAWDLYVTHFEGESNALYLSSGGGVFSERSAAAGLFTPTFPFTGFGTAFVDINHDGFLDIIAVNGRVKRPASPAGESGWLEYAEANQIFLGGADGRFQTQATDSFCAGRGVSRGLAAGDVDGDGDLDLLVTDIAGPARLFRNEAVKAGGWLTVRTVDPRRGGRDAYDAVVTVVAGDTRWTATIQPGSSYLSSSEPVAHFGTGDHQRFDLVRVDWPEGASERFPGGPVNRALILERGTGEAIDEPSPQ